MLTVAVFRKVMWISLF